ncbi:MAG: hypothetical protein KC454_01800 [Flavobacteriales bacterium]|nr:hypothetical protein [Flavobacteriales bacterium]
MDNIWNSLNKIVLFVSYESMAQLESYKKALTLAGLLRENCYIIAIVENKKQLESLKSDDRLVFFHEKEISFLGKNKNDLAKEIFSKSFDLQMSVGDVTKKIMKQLVQMKAKLRIGLNTKQGIFDINLQSEDTTPSHLINFAKSITEKLS